MDKSWLKISYKLLFFLDLPVTITLEHTTGVLFQPIKLLIRNLSCHIHFRTNAYNLKISYNFRFCFSGWKQLPHSKKLIILFMTAIVCIVIFISIHETFLFYWFDWHLFNYWKDLYRKWRPKYIKWFTNTLSSEINRLRWKRHFFFFNKSWSALTSVNQHS